MSRSNQLAGLLTADPPSALDTINEINTALGNDASLSTTLTNSIATKASKSGDTFTGNVIVNKAGTATEPTMRVTSALESSSGIHSHGFSATFLNTSNNANSHGVAIGSKHADSNSLIIGQHDTTFDHFIVKGDGNVGVGTSSPAVKLHVYDSTDHARLSVQCANSSGRHWQFQSRNDGVFWIRDDTGGANRMIFDTSGNVGIGANPASGYKLDVTGTARLRGNVTIDGRNYVATNTANGATKLNWDTGQQCVITNNDTTYNASSVSKLVLNTTAGGYNNGAIIHVEGANAYSRGQLVFSQGWDSSGNAVERMRITNSGNVGVGTDTPSFRICTVAGSRPTYSSISSHSDRGICGNLQPSIACHDIGTMSVNDARNLGFGARYDNDAGGTKPSTYGVIRVFEHYTAETGKGSRHISQLAVAHSNNPVWYVRNSDVSNGSTYSNWYSVTMSNTSDERSKENVTDASNQLDVINKFKVKEFDYINNAGEPRQLGMMAQHVDTFAPEYVTKDDEDPDILWRIKYDRMVPMLVKSIQELSAKVTALENAS